MVSSSFVSHWYDGFTTEDLVLLLPAAQECAEVTEDPIERELWKVRVMRMEDELIRRQNLQDEIEV